MQKLYCYVDETGQDTFGAFFLVSAVVLGSERDEVNKLLERIEQRTHKGKVKWIRTRDSSQLSYIEEILGTQLLHTRISYSVFRNSTAYLDHIARTTQPSIARYAEEDYKATIIVDGLEGKQVQRFSNAIRTLGVRYKKVKGVKDETNAIIRLSDAVCGFARAAISGHPHFTQLLKAAQEQNFISEL
jgi:acylphosphatase